MSASALGGVGSAAPQATATGSAAGLSAEGDRDAGSFSRMLEGGAETPAATRDTPAGTRDAAQASSPGSR